MKKTFSKTTINGTINHYDEKGRKIGSSRPNRFGKGMVNYDAKGHVIGKSRLGSLGRINHYDNKGNKVATSAPNVLNGYVTYDNKGKKISQSRKTIFGGMKHTGK